MRKVVLQEFVSIDGMAAGPNDTVDFIPASTQADSSFGREQSVLKDTVDTLLLGRVTYEMFAGYWPNVTKSPSHRRCPRIRGRLNHRGRLNDRQGLPPAHPPLRENHPEDSIPHPES